MLEMIPLLEFPALHVRWKHVVCLSASKTRSLAQKTEIK